MTINDHVTGLHIYYTLYCYFRMNPLLVKIKFAVNSMSRYACSCLRHLVFPCLDCIIFSLVPDFISCRFINVVSPTCTALIKSPAEQSRPSHVTSTHHSLADSPRATSSPAGSLHGKEYRFLSFILYFY